MKEEMTGMDIKLWTCCSLIVLRNQCIKCILQLSSIGHSSHIWEFGLNLPHPPLAKTNGNKNFQEAISGKGQSWFVEYFANKKV